MHAAPCNTLNVEKNDDALRLAMIRLAKSYGRYGYRKVAQLLRVEGWWVNHKKVERLCQVEGLQSVVTEMIMPGSRPRPSRRSRGFAS